MLFPIVTSRTDVFENLTVSTYVTIEEYGHVEATVILKNERWSEVSSAAAIWIFDRDGEVISAHRRDGLSVIKTATKEVIWSFSLSQFDAHKIAGLMITHGQDAIDYGTTEQSDLERIQSKARSVIKTKTDGIHVFSLPYPTTHEVFDWCKANSSKASISPLMFELMSRKRNMLVAIYNAFEKESDDCKASICKGIERVPLEFARALQEVTSAGIGSADGARLFFWTLCLGVLVAIPILTFLALNAEKGERIGYWVVVSILTVFFCVFGPLLLKNEYDFEGYGHLQSSLSKRIIRG